MSVVRSKIWAFSHLGRCHISGSEDSVRNWFRCCSVAQSCLTLCDTMDCSTPGFPVLHYLLEFAQTHVHWASDSIQPSHPLLSPSPPAPNPSQHQSFPVSRLFTSGGQSIGASASASVLPVNVQGWFHFGWTRLVSLLSSGLYAYPYAVTSCFDHWSFMCKF